MTFSLSSAAPDLFINEIKVLSLDGNVTSFHIQWWIHSLTFLKHSSETWIDHLLSVQWGPELQAVQ